MKKVLRSTFDPLPRSLSTPGLVSLVLVVVLGTAVTVSRYMESSGHPRTEVHGKGSAQTLGKRLEMRGSCEDSRARSLGSSGRTSGFECDSSTTSASSCSTPAPAAEPASASPSAFEPD